MTSQVYVSPPFPLEKLREEIKPQLQLFLSPHDHHSAASPTSLSNAPTSLNNPTQDHHKVDKYNKSVGGSSNREVVRFDAGHAAKKVFLCKREYGFDDNHELEMENSDGSKMIITSNCTNDDKPAKFRLKFQAPPHYVNYSFPSSSNNVRVCADCNTTTTPLWRSGPRGPKTLCNACGIRQRKARRAMALAANGVAAETTSSSIKAKTSKEKKLHVSLLQCKPPDHNQSQKKLCLKNIALSLSSKKSTFQGMLPQDVEEAAVLLMELSCGFIHS
ncbi:putative GATA transcription factor 22 [Tripterygium wilfordii]|uniref:Putative GATA transcription factor 22 n=1 Tax=Tripterygium wilfordii TaxID=458696 RepID=A0A7J7DPS9_TRIWF|nr:putative GATA transcription factor 22 [Tripterygium wilfordii]KAF5748317.1 putative GATA transcription factor 22 [Tripterygium wilfordii]